MPTDPKTPEEILQEWIVGAKEHWHPTAECDHGDCPIDNLAAIAVLVGRIQQHQGECIHPTPCALVDRLLAEMEKES